MDVFWFVIGVAVTAACYLVCTRGIAKRWWHWVLIVLLGAWCVFGLDMAATTYAEGNARGGNIFLGFALLTDLVGWVIVRALVRAGKPKAAATMAKAAKAAK